MYDIKIAIYLSTTPPATASATEEAPLHNQGMIWLFLKQHTHKKKQDTILTVIVNNCQRLSIV